MKDERYILSIDLGTSGPKVALFTTEGRFVAYEYERNEVILLPRGGAEQDPQDWWRAIKIATRRLLERKLAPVERIEALSCTTQWSGTVAVDRDGQPLMNAIIWMDARGAAYIPEIAGGMFKVQGYNIFRLLTWLRLTGGIPGHAGKDPIAHILYIKHEQPEVYQQTYKFLEPKDYINLRLTGKFAASYDSITLHWLTDTRDLTRVDYSERLLSLAGMERDKFPDLRPAVEILGSLQPSAAEELGLHPNVQVMMGTPDVQSAALGSGAARDFAAHLYIGTSSWIGCHVPHKKTDILHNLAALPSAIPDRYLVCNEQQTSGACLTFLRDNILYHKDELGIETDLPDIYKVFDRIAERVPAGSGNLIFTPWLYGERTPVDDHKVRGGLYNLSLDTKREHIIRAVYEGVAYNARWLFGYVEKFIGKRIEWLNVIGGGAISNVWCQIFADVLDREIRQVEQPILANARGAAYLAAVALGTMRFDEIDERIEIARQYQPNPENRKVYDQLFKEFLNIYRHNSPINARLNS
ncbi:MAG TPA: FGGY-family carbohydrate kinase [Anaerolineales bacterium]|nr:FGGY-family carbohydrate kinase [Anaerolineales bacterium]